MASLYVVLYQFQSALNAKNFIANNSAIDATAVTVTTAQSIQPGNWVVVFPENLNQLPTGYTPQFTYNGGTQQIAQFNPNLDVTTISIIVTADGTPIFYRGLPVTDLANGPTAGVTGHWQDGGWQVQYIYPHPTIELAASASGDASTLYEFAGNNPSSPIVHQVPPANATQGGIWVGTSGITISHGPNLTLNVPDVISGLFGPFPDSGPSGPPRDYGQLAGQPSQVMSVNFSGTTLGVSAIGYPVSDFTLYAFDIGGFSLLGVWAIPGGPTPLPGTTISLDVSTITAHDINTGTNYVFDSIVSPTSPVVDSNLGVTVTFKLRATN